MVTGTCVGAVQVHAVKYRRVPSNGRKSVLRIPAPSEIRGKTAGLFWASKTVPLFPAPSKQDPPPPHTHTILASSRNSIGSGIRRKKRKSTARQDPGGALGARLLLPETKT